MNVPISKSIPCRTFLGEEYVAVPNRVDPRGTHLIHKNPGKNWIGGAEVLRAKGRELSWNMAMLMFISQFEFMAHAHDIYGYGTLTWADAEQARADAELASILLGGYIRLLDYGGESVALAVDEMKQSARRWLPTFARCLEWSDYTALALPAGP